MSGAGVAITGNSLNNLAFIGQTGNYIELSSNALDNVDINATAVTYDGVLGSAATVSEGLAIEAKLFHELDNNSLGLIQVTANTIYVPSTGYSGTTPTATDNDYTRIRNAIEAAGNGFTIILQGTFDWTELNAAAAGRWATTTLSP